VSNERREIEDQIADHGTVSLMSDLRPPMMTVENNRTPTDTSEREISSACKLMPKGNQSNDHRNTCHKARLSMRLNPCGHIKWRDASLEPKNRDMTFKEEEKKTHPSSSFRGYSEPLAQGSSHDAECRMHRTHKINRWQILTCRSPDSHVLSTPSGSV
jgi:hypothetical protein